VGWHGRHCTRFSTFACQANLLEHETGEETHKERVADDPSWLVRLRLDVQGSKDIKNPTEALAIAYGTVIQVGGVDRPRGSPKGYRNVQLGLTRCVFRTRGVRPVSSAVSPLACTTTNRERIRTEREIARHITSEGHRVWDSTLNCVHGGSRPTDKCSTSIDGCRIRIADVNHLAIYSHACQNKTG
jgi:hypothetical protein